ncbi:hypothetical protein BDV12DRAFT_195626 [Aspergillus spectabilis]
MLTSLGTDEDTEHNTIPVLMTSIFGGLVRVLQARYSHEGLVIRKTRLLDISTAKEAIPNMDMVDATHGQ